jgi:hypothetical protein
VGGGSRGQSLPENEELYEGVPCAILSGGASTYFYCDRVES